MVALEEALEQNRICYWVARMCRDLVVKELSSEATNAATSKSVEHFYITAFLGREAKLKADSRQ